MSACEYALFISLSFCDSVSKTFWESERSHVGTRHEEGVWGWGGGFLSAHLLRLFNVENIYAAVITRLLGGPCLLMVL